MNAKLASANQQVMALYAERNEQACQLKRSDAMKTRCLSCISHEFRSALNSIFALTTLRLHRVDGELICEQDEQVGFIRKAADSLHDLVNDLSNLAKIAAGEIDVHQSKFEAAELLGSSRGMLAAPLLAPPVRLVFEETAGIPFLSSDESKVSQILRNFIDNASKFTERGEVRVAVSHDPGNDAVIFSVRDIGIGMAPADSERIFDEFTQLKSPAQSGVWSQRHGSGFAAVPQTGHPVGRPRYVREHARRWARVWSALKERKRSQGKRRNGILEYWFHAFESC